jgi:hypothetical protein
MVGKVGAANNKKPMLTHGYYSTPEIRQHKNRAESELANRLIKQMCGL